MQYFFFLAVGIVFLWLAFRQVDMAAFWQGFLQVRWGYVLASIAIALLSHWFRGLRWRLLIHARQQTSISAWDAFWAVMVGYLANLALPRMGEVVRCSILAQHRRLSLSYLFGTVVLERLTDMLVLAVLLVVVVGLQADILWTFIQEHLLISAPDPQTLILLLLALAFLVFLTWIIFIRWARRATFGQRRLLVRLRQIVRQLRWGLTTIFHLPRPVQVRFWFYTALIWIAYVAMTYLPAFALPATQSMTLDQALGMFVMGSLGIVAPVQGGIGTYHWLVQQTLMLYGYDPTVALQLATLIHTAQTIMVIIVGFLGFLYFALQKKS